jgi:hypothetical protein
MLNAEDVRRLKYLMPYEQMVMKAAMEGKTSVEFIEEHDTLKHIKNNLVMDGFVCSEPRILEGHQPTAMSKMVVLL